MYLGSYPSDNTTSGHIYANCLANDGHRAIVILLAINVIDRVKVGIKNRKEVQNYLCKSCCVFLAAQNNKNHR